MAYMFACFKYCLHTFHIFLGKGNVGWLEIFAQYRNKDIRVQSANRRYTVNKMRHRAIYNHLNLEIFSFCVGVFLSHSYLLR